MGKRITDKVTWVGKVDWELVSFHGNEYSTHRGSSYNSYLIRDDKTVLIDTVWQPFDKEFVTRLAEEVDLKSIDYIVMNHNEIDHSGSLPELMHVIPDVPIYCTAKGEQILRGHYHQDWNYVNVKTGDTLDLGGSTLTFIEAPMLHWPDTMFTYMSGDDILFSTDAFGQHFATESLFDDCEDSSELFHEAEKYYANIINMYSPMANRKVHELLDKGLDISMICPSHGVVWRKDVSAIVERYLKWSDAYQENQVTIVYDSMWNSTRKMAEAIGEGIRQADPSMTVKILNSGKEDKNDICTEIFHSRAVLLGSSTINNGYLYSIGGMLEMIKGLKFKNKKGAAFGSYGWSGEAVAQMTKDLGECGIEVVDDGLRLLWVPDQDAIDKCREYGREFVGKL